MHMGSTPAGTPPPNSMVTSDNGDHDEPHGTTHGTIVDADECTRRNSNHARQSLGIDQLASLRQLKVPAYSPREEVDISREHVDVGPVVRNSRLAAGPNVVVSNGSNIGSFLDPRRRHGQSDTRTSRPSPYGRPSHSHNRGRLSSDALLTSHDLISEDSRATVRVGETTYINDRQPHQPSLFLNAEIVTISGSQQFAPTHPSRRGSVSEAGQDFHDPFRYMTVHQSDPILFASLKMDPRVDSANSEASGTNDDDDMESECQSEGEPRHEQPANIDFGHPDSGDKTCVNGSPAEAVELISKTKTYSVNPQAHSGAHDRDHVSDDHLLSCEQSNFGIHPKQSKYHAQSHAHTSLNSVDPIRLPHPTRSSASSSMPTGSADSLDPPGSSEEELLSINLLTVHWLQDSLSRILAEVESLSPGSFSEHSSSLENPKSGATVRTDAAEGAIVSGGGNGKPENHQELHTNQTKSLSPHSAASLVTRHGFSQRSLASSSYSKVINCDDATSLDTPHQSNAHSPTVPPATIRWMRDSLVRILAEVESLNIDPSDGRSENTETTPTPQSSTANATNTRSQRVSQEGRLDIVKGANQNVETVGDRSFDHRAESSGGAADAARVFQFEESVRRLDHHLTTMAETLKRIEAGQCMMVLPETLSNPRGPVADVIPRVQDVDHHSQFTLMLGKVLVVQGILKDILTRARVRGIGMGNAFLGLFGMYLTRQ
ncbi:hypothetical protein BV25DRAFT_1920087 [Artomyces pyxidatus]|uniref:Uncharacterized protein n=1 Tax=Artomyces pyxidatus TaxID=48021 RepID=A0ACB8SNG7_9AGAM|nr:hypothetical protein BV25DRAFT_1920087 [Artomyces pyxidatus]